MRRNEKAKKASSMYDVARAARVSVFTVSQVVNKREQVSAALQRRVDTAIQQLNYRPNLLARSFAKRQTQTIGIVVPDIANPFFPQVVRGAEDAAQQGGFSTLLCNSDSQKAKEEAYIELLLSKRVDGILLTKASGSFTPALQHMLDDANIPIVLMMRTCPDMKRDAVLTDDRKGALEAVSHLARIGYQKIAMVAGPHGVSNSAARMQGFRKALQDHGLAYHKELVIEGDYRIESGYRAGLSLLPRRPDAIFVANYLMTVGLMQAADEMRMRCPEDFGLVSFDDYPWLNSFRPRLTAVELPKYDLGMLAAKVLLSRISGEKGPVVVHRLLPQLRVRESCGFALRMQKPQTDTQGVTAPPGGFTTGASSAVGGDIEGQRSPLK